MNSLFVYIPALLCWGILISSMCKDMRRFRNCVFLLFALVSLVPILLEVSGDHAEQVAEFIVLLTIAVLLIVPVLLVLNGMTMMKKEGRSLANILSLLFGVVIGAGEVMMFAALLYTQIDYRVSAWLLILSMSVVYVSLAFLCFMFYSLFIGLVPRRRDFDFVIIHGCGLLHGNKMSKLLQQRCDKAIELYEKDMSPPIMIPSGGQGPDETDSEAHVMAQYLIEKGVDPKDIIEEDRSMNTMENLKNSKEIILKYGGRAYTALVTSNYHVYRVLSYSRKLGFRCTGVGSRVALYYWPSALIREFVAVLRERRHMILFALGWLVFLAPWIILLLP